MFDGLGRSGEARSARVSNDCSFQLAVICLRGLRFGPEAVSGALYKHVFQSWTAHIDRSDLTGEGFHHVRRKPMTLGLLQANRLILNRARHAKALQDPGGEGLRVFCLKLNDITANLRLECCRSSEPNKFALAEDRKAAAAFRLLHQMSGDKNSHSFVLA